MKITTRNLDQFTEQQVFDYIVEHLRKQGRKSINSKGSCLYRGPDGLKCAAGIFIEDEDYSYEFEGHSWLVTSKRIGTPANENIISEFQSIHDNIPIFLWEQEFNGLAVKKGLEYKPVLRID